MEIADFMRQNRVVIGVESKKTEDILRAIYLEKLETLMHQKIFIDLRNVYDPEKLKTRGFAYVGVDRS